MKDAEARIRAANDLAHSKDAQISDLRREIDRLTAEYKDLMDIKLQLDEELSTYDMLLYGEESRYVSFELNSGAMHAFMNRASRN